VRRYTERAEAPEIARRRTGERVALRVVMLRPVRDEVIWLHGAYRFRNRVELDQTIEAAKRLLTFSGTALGLSCEVIDDAVLRIVVRVPFFDERDFVSHLFGLLARCSEQGALEARVDVL
jgi:hypothetical protein